MEGLEGSGVVCRTGSDVDAAEEDGGESGGVSQA